MTTATDRIELHGQGSTWIVTPTRIGHLRPERAYEAFATHPHNSLGLVSFYAPSVEAVEQRLAGPTSAQMAQAANRANPEITPLYF